MILKLNESQNNLQLIQIDENYVVVDLVAEIHKGDWFYSIPRLTIHKCTAYTETCYIDSSWQNKEEVEIVKNDCVKIIFASQNINLEGVKVIEEKFISTVLPNKQQVNDGLEIPIWINGYKEGYKQAKENSPYTKEEILDNFEFEYNKFINSGGLVGASNEWIDHSKLIPWFKIFIESLNQLKVELTFDENNQPLTCKLL